MIHGLRIAAALLLLVVRALLFLVVFLLQQLSGQLDSLVPAREWRLVTAKKRMMKCAAKGRSPVQNSLVIV